MTNKELARKLAEHNKWRRGKGKYAKAGVLMPFSPRELGELIDEAAKRLSILPDPPEERK